MTNVDAINAKRPAIKATRKHNQRNAPSLSAFVLDLAKRKVTSETGAVEAVAKYEPTLITLTTQYEQCLKSGGSVRELMLNYFYTTTEGAKLAKQRDALPKGKAQSETQKSTAMALKKFENAVRNQLERAVDTYRGVALLRSQSRKVHIEEVANTGTYACYVRAEKVLNEQTNQIFNATALQTLCDIQKAFNQNTPTVNVLAMCKAHNKKNGAPNKEKGGENDALPVAHIGKVLRQLDTALSPLAHDNIIEGVSKTTRESAHALWARLDAAMTDDDKANARKAFAALAAKPEPKKSKGKKAA